MEVELVKLTKQELQEAENFLKDPSNSSVISSRLSAKNIECLKPAGWLDSHFIGHYFELCQKKSDDLGEKGANYSGIFYFDAGHYSYYTADQYCYNHITPEAAIKRNICASPLLFC